MKKILAVVLALVLCLGVAAPAYAEYASASTTLFGSSSDKLNNLELAASLLDGASVNYGKTFSFNQAIGPRTKARGFVDAVNGRGVEVKGGGVSQLASTLYLALGELDCVEIEPFKVYGEKFREWYVDSGEDAIITDYDAGTDFRFTSWYPGTLYISAWLDDEDVYVSIDSEPGSGFDSDAVASAATPLFGSDNKRHNIELASSYITGTMLERNETFSFNDIVGPRTRECGFYSALNGRGVKVYGGGVAQVASTVYLAVKELDCVRVDPVRTYGKKFVDGYVSDPDDAIVTDYNAGTDFSFTYKGYGTLTVELYEDDDQLICNIYEDN